jgi:hypothetical protein
VALEASIGVVMAGLVLPVGGEGTKVATLDGLADSLSVGNAVGINVDDAKVGI